MLPSGGIHEELQQCALSQRTGERRAVPPVHAISVASAPTVLAPLQRAVPHREDFECCSRRRSQNEGISDSKWKPFLAVAALGRRQLDHGMQGDTKVWAVFLRLSYQID